MTDQHTFSEPDAISFQEVLEALQDEERVLAPRYLYRFSDLAPRELQDLKSIWEDISTRRRRALLEDLEQLTYANTLLSFELVFRFAIHDQDARVRFCALRSIEVFDTDDLVPTFLEILKQDESVDVRALAASVLGKYVYRGEVDELEKEVQKDIENTLLEVLNSGEHNRVRRHALEALGFSPREEVYEWIAEAYQRDEAPWVASALFAMGRSYDHVWDEHVLSKLYHPSPAVRAEAVRASGELGLEEAVPAMLEMLDDVTQVREAAIWSLSQVGGEGIEEAFIDLLQEPLVQAEKDLIERALENLSFTMGGIDYTMFSTPADHLDEQEDEYWYLDEDDWLD